MIRIMQRSPMILVRIKCLLVNYEIRSLDLCAIKEIITTYQTRQVDRRTEGHQ